MPAPSGNPTASRATGGSRVRKIASRLRFSLYTATLALAASAVGIALLYVAFLVWRKGVFTLRRFGVVYESTSPGAFYFLLVLGIAFGLTLLAVTPLIAAKLF